MTEFVVGIFVGFWIGVPFWGLILFLLYSAVENEKDRPNRDYEVSYTRYAGEYDFVDY